MRGGVTCTWFIGFRYPSRLGGVVMVSAGNSQDSPQHGGGNSQPTENQHHYGHCQAHQCLLFALLRAHTLCK
ncbi:hypothetical protein EMIT0P44_110149 [Pseudomonas sp. IT-P44]